MPGRILITGGSGFVASYVARSCAQRKYDVILQSRGCKIPDDLACNKYVKLLTTSIFSNELETLENIDSIIHFASAGVSPRKAGWNELEEINIKGTLIMCQLAQKLKSKLVVAGSFAEYGKSGLRYDEIPVDAPLEPTFPYAVSKSVACQLSLGFARSEGLSLAYLRIFNAFGHGQHSSNLWPSLVKAAQLGQDFPMTKGEQIRDFVPIETVASIFTQVAIEHELREGSPYIANVGSGKQSTVLEFSETWWRQLNAKGVLKVGAVPYRANEVMKFVPSLKPAYL